MSHADAVDAKEALKAALASSLAPYLRSEGFTGSGRTFTLTGDRLDRAIVNVQGSQGSSTHEQVFYVNLSVVPRPWAEFSLKQLGQDPDRPRHEHGLYRTRLEPSDPTPTPGRWRVEHPRRAAPVVDELVARLAEPAGVPRLRSLLDRRTMIEQLHTGDLGHIRRVYGSDVYLDRAMAILLADDGDSPELDVVKQRLGRAAVETTAEQHRAVLAWVDARAARPS